MELPKVIKALLSAQAAFNSEDYAKCFTPDAVVFDEGATHTGRQEIKHWNEKTNANYQITLEPVAYSASEQTSILKTEVSGTFPGSPIVLLYHFTLKDEMITALTITGS
ncbi:nuclear transport factor 2 family protein [Dyadobacter psychrotolerans]|uniref:Nuclear transport factor 2 family protein n=1 Tax=Dyadobacter psychrotolerans TaxID=2541721 RepID=A0A4R5E0K8_9BACT|nr:nuclear transport factor 2 family protein [Dyadobacter psychrotolerans]TDE17113.1 nuclear transport factor 2 family protein [Dyadobacter psychrotolerans]